MIVSDIICRICLGDHNLNCIFKEDYDVVISEKIMYCASVQVSEADLLPKMICNQCLFYLNTAYVFKTVCEASDKKLKILIKAKCTASTVQESIVESVGDEANGCEQNGSLKTLNDLSSDRGEFLYEDSVEPCFNEEVVTSTEIEKTDFLYDEEIILPENCIDRNEKFLEYNSACKNVETEQQGNVNTVTKNVVGRHIAKKNSGKCPKRFRQTTSPLKDKKSQPDNDEENDKLNNVNVCCTSAHLIDDSGQKLSQNNTSEEHILESEIPSVIFEETVITEVSEVSQNESNDVKGEVGNETIGSPKQNNILTGRKYKLRKSKGRKQKFKYSSDNFKIKLNSAKFKNTKRKVNVFNDHTICKTKQKSKTTCTIVAKSPDLKTNEKTNLQCDVCGKFFPFRSHLIRHLNVHTGIKRYACEYCKKKFINNYNLSVHTQKHTGDFPYSCEICGKGYSTPSLLKRHINSHTGETIFQCRYCMKKFSQSSSLKLHERMHLHRPSYTCDICFKIFSYTNSLAAHKKTHSTRKEHVCSVCHKAFTRKQSLLRHMTGHTESKKMLCKYCSMSFNNNSNYMIHLKTHSKYKCDYCQEILQSKTLLVNHVKKHKECFKCEQCLKQFNGKSQLIKHLEKHIIDEKKGPKTYV